MRPRASIQIEEKGNGMCSTSAGAVPRPLAITEFCCGSIYRYLIADTQEAFTRKEGHLGDARNIVSLSSRYKFKVKGLRK